MVYAFNYLTHCTTAQFIHHTDYIRCSLLDLMSPKLNWLSDYRPQMIYHHLWLATLKPPEAEQQFVRSWSLRNPEKVLGVVGTREWLKNSLSTVLMSSINILYFSIFKQIKVHPPIIQNSLDCFHNVSNIIFCFNYFSDFTTSYEDIMNLPVELSGEMVKLSEQVSHFTI